MRGVFARLLLVVALFLQVGIAPAHADVRTGQVGIVYGEVRDPALVVIAARVRGWQLMEKVRSRLNALRLPRKLTLVLKSCDGLKEAWFDDDGVTVCYEYLQVNYEAAKVRANAGGASVSADDVLAAALLDALLHETAHALMEYLEIPVLGREEDAADQLAAYQILRRPKEEARRLVMGVAFTYVEDIRILTLQGETQSRVKTDRWRYSGSHATPAQRFYNLLCLAYGSDATLFADLVARDILPRYRSRGCEDEYKQIERAWIKLLQPHEDTALAAKADTQPWLDPVAAPKEALVPQP